MSEPILDFAAAREAELASRDGNAEMNKTFRATLEAQAQAAVAEVERERDEACSMIPPSGDGACDHCGRVPSVDIPTRLCDECCDGVARAEAAEAKLAAALGVARFAMEAAQDDPLRAEHQRLKDAVVANLGSYLTVDAEVNATGAADAWDEVFQSWKTLAAFEAQHPEVRR